MKKKLLMVFIVIFLFTYSCTVYASVEVSDINISNELTTCAELLGPNLVKIIKACINLVRLTAIIIALVYSMILLVPPIIDKDSEALNKVLNKLVNMYIVLVIILMLPSIVKIIGNILNYDLTCIF